MLKSVKLHETVLAKINSWKKSGESINDIVLKMLTYFEVTGTNPNQVQVHPTVKLLSEFERVIKILKSQEKNKLDVILAVVKDLKSGETTTHISDTSAEIVEGVTIEQLQTVTDTNQRLEDHLKAEREKNAKLQDKINKLESMNNNNIDLPAGLVARDEIVSAVKWLESQFRSIKFSSDLSVTKEALQAFKDRIMDKL